MEERIINLGGKNSTRMQPGERIVVITPGGGGWGHVGDDSKIRKQLDARHAWRGGSVASILATQESSM
jgi:5-oxoprolinase (ATP-hydrolysing)